MCEIFDWIYTRIFISLLFEKNHDRRVKIKKKRQRRRTIMDAIL